MDMIIVGSLACLGFLLFVLSLIHTGTVRKLLVKLGLAESRVGKNWTASSWESCLKKMDCKADVVMFGDSLMRGSNIHEHYSSLRFVNLGSSGDTLAGMLGRISTVSVLEPQKVFFMGGINGLTDYNLSQCVKKYGQLLDALRKTVPEAELYVLSLLPLSREKARSRVCKNETIRKFNEKIRELAEGRGLTYIDIHDAYVLDGAMDPSLTSDGVHLKPEAYARWNEALIPYLEK